jgi:xanthine/uracil/vitamin C permease (AzgA family)
MEQLVEERAGSRARRWREDLPVAATAAVVAGVGWTVARLAGLDLAVRTGSRTQHVGVIAVVVTAVLVTMVGGLLRRVLERRATRGRLIWTWLAVGVLLVSLLTGPTAARSVAAGLALAGLHLLVGAVVIVGSLRPSAHRVVA